MRLGSVTLSPPVKPFWLLIPQPFHTAHLDTWILLPSGGDLLVWHSCPWRFHTSPTLVQHNPQHLTHLTYTLYTETHAPAPAESLFTLLPRPDSILYILSMAKASGL